MSMPLESAPFSEPLRQPTETAERPSRARAVRLHRRDATTSGRSTPGQRVNAKRGDRAAPPPRPDAYTLRFATNDTAEGWEELCRQAATNTRATFDKPKSPALSTRPAGVTSPRIPNRSLIQTTQANTAANREQRSPQYWPAR